MLAHPCGVGGSVWEEGNKNFWFFTYLNYYQLKHSMLFGLFFVAQAAPLYPAQTTPKTS